MKQRIIHAILLTALVSVAFTPGAQAADKITTLHWDIGVPLGDMENYIDNVSYRGFGFDFRTFRDRSKSYTVGFSFAWQVFDKKTDELIHLDQDQLSGDIKGTQRRYVNALPFMIAFDLYTSQDPRKTRFFIGLGAGAYYIIQRFEIGVASFEENNWHFGLMPEAGLQFPMGDVELLVQARYNYAFASGSTITGESIDWQYATVNFGFAWSRW